MSENQVFVSVGLDEVVDSDAFRVLAVHAELGLPVEATEESETELS